MADVEIKYKGKAIAELDGTSSKALATKNVWCEEDIEVSHVSNSRSYEITLVKSSAWTLLVELDEETLKHINDKNFTVTLINTDDYVASTFSESFFAASNTPVFDNGTKKAYGTAFRETSGGNSMTMTIYYPANSTESPLAEAAFRVDGNKYYVKSSSGVSVKGGTYRLAFTW